MLDLREHRKTPDRLSDLLPWAALVSPETVLNKDGSFQATIRYRGPDLDSSTQSELISNSAAINNILRRFGNGWAVYAEASRYTSNIYPVSEFPNKVSELIDNKRKEKFQCEPHYNSSYYLTLCFLPPMEKTNKMTSYFLNSKAEDSSSSNSFNYTNILENFISEIHRIADLLTRLFPEVELLENDNLLSYLHSTVSSDAHYVKTPSEPMYLDAILADSEFLGGFSPKLGDKHLAIIGLLGFPSATQPGLLDHLNRLSLEYRWTTRFICLDKNEAKKEIETYQRKWFAKRKGVASLIKELMTKEESALSDSEALAKAEDAQVAMLELGSDDISYGFMTTNIVLMNKNKKELNLCVNEVQKVLQGEGFSTRIETVNAVDAWLGTIPSNTRNNVRRPLISTMNLAHLLPGTSAVWAGNKFNEHLDSDCLMLTETAGATPFRLNTHCGDVGHTLILGPTGSGKSTLLNLMEAQFLRYKDAQVYIFDKGMSAYCLTTALGGKHYSLGQEQSDLCFQPLANVDDEAERKWAHDWLLSIAGSENVEITPQIKSALWDALGSVAAAPKNQRTLHSLMVYMQNHELRAAFEPFTQTGAYGKLIDNSEDNLEYSNWQCFEMEALMENQAVIAPVLTYLFHRLSKSFTGKPTLLVLDEAWLFLDHPIFANKIREWLKTLRKLNVSVIFATQSLADVSSSSISATIKEACFTKIYLPNSVALQPDATEFYKSFGLNDRQIQILAYTTNKKDYYFTSPDGNRVFDLGLEELQLAYLSGVSKERIKLIKEIKAKSSNLEEFNYLYLEALGLSAHLDHDLDLAAIKTGIKEQRKQEIDQNMRKVA